MLKQLLALSLGLGVAAGADKPLASLLAEGDRAEERGDADGAAEIFSRAARVFPASPLPRYRLARCHSRASRIVPAIVEARAALDLDRRHVPSHVLLGRLYRDAGLVSLAEAEFGEALRLAPAGRDAAILLAGILLDRELPGRAAETIEGALRARPRDAALLYLSGRARSAAGDSAGAATRFESAVAQDPALAPAWLALGVALGLRPDQTARAHAALEKAVALEPSNAEAHGALGALYLRLDAADKALAHLGRAAELGPGDPEAHYRLASALARAGRGEEAARARDRSQELRAAVERRRQDDLAFTGAFREGQALTQSNRLAEAAVKFEEALRVKPGSDTAHAMLAKVLLSRRDPASAEGHIVRAIEASPANGEYRYVHALGLRASGDLAAAEAELQLAAGLAPQIGDVFSQLGTLSAARGDWSQAVSRYKRAILAEPDEPVFHLNLAKAYDVLGKPQLAAIHRKRHRDLSAPAGGR